MLASYLRSNLRKKKKLNRCSQKYSYIPNYKLLDKNKIKFLMQIFSWFSKDFKYYKINFFLKKLHIISDCDIINLSVKTQKAGLNNLLKKLNYSLKYYKKLKRSSYTLNFVFFFVKDLHKKNNKEITLDIKFSSYKIINIFITTDFYYIEGFYTIINALSDKICNKKKKDANDLMLENIDYIFSWNRLGKVICYELYMPWYLKKENYYIQKNYKTRIERKYRCIIKERKFSGIFPLKNVIGHLIVANKENMLLLRTVFKNDNFRRKEDLFKELKKSINWVNFNYKVDSHLVYFFIQYKET